MYVTISQETERPVLSRQTGRSGMRQTRLKPGGYLFFEGDEVERLYQIEKGVLRLTRVLKDGRRQVIAFGYPGDVIGFPSNGLHHTDCDALTPAELTLIPRTALENCRGDAQLHAALMTAAMNEISAMQDHFMMLGRKSAPERVASFLRVLLDRIGDTDRSPPTIQLPMSRSDIADFLGLTTETVCRCITSLRKAGIIRLDGANTIEVLDRQGLVGQADGRLN